MKRIKQSIALAAAAFLLAGCVTTSTGPSQTAINVAIGIRATVPWAVAVAVEKDPSTAAYFQTASRVVLTASAGTNFNAAELLAALDAIPVPDGQNWQIAKLAVAGGVSIYAGLGNAGLISTLDANYCLSALAGSIIAGLPPETPATVKMRFKSDRDAYAKILKGKQ